MNILNEPEVSKCNIGNISTSTCEVFTMGNGLNVSVIHHTLDNEAINKYDGMIAYSGSQSPKNKIIIANKEGYEYNFISAVNYKIHSIQIPINSNSFVEISENSKNPIVTSNDWKNIVSTFKFTK